MHWRLSAGRLQYKGCGGISIISIGEASTVVLGGISTSIAPVQWAHCVFRRGIGGKAIDKTPS